MARTIRSHNISGSSVARLCIIALLVAVNPPRSRAEESRLTLLDYQIKVETVLSQEGNDWLWFLPSAVRIPNVGRDGSTTTLIMVMKHLAVSDHYSGPYIIRSDNGGNSWSNPEAPFGKGWRIDEYGTTVAVGDVTPRWHSPTGKILAIGGQTRHNKAGAQLTDKPRSWQTVYTVYDPTANNWTPLRTLVLPDTEATFFLAISSCGQWLVKEDGTLLVPIYLRGASELLYSSMVLHCHFDGNTLKYLAHGNKISLNVSRGAYEPSLTYFRGRYYLTIRNDEKGYLTTSDDGLHFEPLKSWTFDDGEELGSYNTQQHWLVHSDGLFLVYTRRGANNDNVPRHRAPLFIAQVDSEKLCVIRRSERVLIPNSGLTLGNFGATAITRNESWVTVAEGVSAGSPNNVYVARILWDNPNHLLDKDD